MTEATAAKAAVRQRLLAARAALPDARRAAGSAAVCRRLARLPELAVAGNVLGYAAMATEVDVDAALRALLARGVHVHLPWVDGPRLGIAEIGDLDADLVVGWRGVREPAPCRRRPQRAGVLDAVLVPGVAFDHGGRRLGYGGGHFDRLLACLRPGAATIGMAFDEQIVDALPVEPHDRRVDVVVTPKRTIRPDDGAR